MNGDILQACAILEDRPVEVQFVALNGDILQACAALESPRIKGPILGLYLNCLQCCTLRKGEWAYAFVFPERVPLNFFFFFTPSEGTTANGLHFRPKGQLLQPRSVSEDVIADMLEIAVKRNRFDEGCVTDALIAESG